MPITDVRGVRVGHWTDATARTGCSVVLLPAGTSASGEVRGGAPGTREWALLDPERLVDRVDAVVLTGGSAFGLAAADGVVRWCEERGIGFPTSAGPVPIVVAAVIYDLGVGDATRRPGPEDGFRACTAATSRAPEEGAVGAGCGATVSKWRGRDAVARGGFGTASARHGDVVVGAAVVVNAWGDVVDPAGARPEPDLAPLAAPPAPFAEHTTIGVVATNARLDKLGCRLVAQSANDGVAHAVVPAHALADGDAMVAAATGDVVAPVELVRALAARTVADAVRRAVR